RFFDAHQPGVARYSRLSQVQGRIADDREAGRPRVPRVQAGLSDPRGYPGDADRRGQATDVSESSTDAQRTHRLVKLAWLAIGIYLLALGISAVLRVQGDFNVYYRAGT